MKPKLCVKNIAANDLGVKLIFDHFRNLGICSAVFAAAVWQIRHTDVSWQAQLIGHVTGGLLSLLGFWLFAVNQRHGFLKLLESGISRQRALFIGQIYSLVSITLIASIVIR